MSAEIYRIVRLEREVGQQGLAENQHTLLGVDAVVGQGASYSLSRSRRTRGEPFNGSLPNMSSTKSMVLEPAPSRIAYNTVPLATPT